MIRSGIVLDPSGAYRVQDGFRLVESDTDVLALGQLEQVWAKGDRAVSAVQRLARDRELETLCLIPPKAWFVSTGLPESLVASEASNIAQFFLDDPPTTESDARDLVRLWATSSRFSFVLGLLDDADQLVAAFADERLTGAPLDLLRWFVRSRGDLGQSRLLTRLLESDDPIAYWLGLNEVDGTKWIAAAGNFVPSKLPPHIVVRFQAHWRDLLVKGRFDLAAEALRASLPKSLSSHIRRVASEVHQRLSPRHQAAFEADARVIFGPRWRPSRPASMRWVPLTGTEEIAEMLDWFRQYRAELSWRSSMPSERVVAAQSFRRWYLARERFPRWCVGGEAGNLSFRVNSIIRDAQRDHGVTLVVIIDGLGHEEHIRLLDDLYQRTAALHIRLDLPVLSALPTITPICKGALLSGRPQRERANIQPDYPKLVRECANVNFRGRYLETWNQAKVVKWLVDPDTSLVVVNHIELDKQLHNCTSGADAEARIEGALNYMATSIASLVEQVEGEVESLAVIICSDHGQVVGPCRAAPPPSEVLHQRLRVATSDKRPNEEDLPAAVSLCSEDYWFVDDDSAWSGSDELVFGCHGGVFPEEVITRVTLLSTIPSKPQVRVTGRGDGISGVSGTLTWTVINASNFEISVVRSSLLFADKKVILQPLSREVPANTQRESSPQALDNWPTQDQLSDAMVEIEYVAGGKPQTVSGLVKLDVSPGYESSTFSL